MSDIVCALGLPIDFQEPRARFFIAHGGIPVDVAVGKSHNAAFVLKHAVGCVPRAIGFEAARPYERSSGRSVGLGAVGDRRSCELDYAELGSFISPYLASFSAHP